MNTSQRKFLVDKIKEKIEKSIKELRDRLEESPSTSNYIFKASLNGTLKIHDETHILNAIKEKALKAKEGSNWLSDERMGLNKENSIRFMLNDIIHLPDDYYTQKENVNKHNKLIYDQIDELKAQLNTIEIRIQLASDKKLESLINEVDDMGDLKLIDTKLKLLN